jgi:hypothetical protein
METEVIDRAVWRCNLKFEDIGEKCMKLHPSDNIWQAVEKVKLLKREFLFEYVDNLSPQTRQKRIAALLEISEVADYFANKMANLELRGLIC